jgi:hypothetical protein
MLTHNLSRFLVKRLLLVANAHPLPAGDVLLHLLSTDQHELMYFLKIEIQGKIEAFQKPGFHGVYVTCRIPKCPRQVYIRYCRGIFPELYRCQGAVKSVNSCRLRNIRYEKKEGGKKKKGAGSYICFFFFLLFFFSQLLLLVTVSYCSLLFR